MAGQLRWWFVDRFSRTPGGTRTQVSGERFAGLMGKLDVSASVEVTDHLGDEPTRSLSMSFSRPRLFRVADVIEANDLLKRLHALAQMLRRDRNASPEVAAQKVESIVGPGRLATSLRGHSPDAAVPEPVEVKPTVDAKPEATEKITLDELLQAAPAPAQSKSKVSAVKTGLDAFVGAILGAPSKPKVIAKAARESAAEIIEAAVTQTALELLGHPDVASLEASWRGLKMVMGATPGHDQLSVELVDADPMNLAGGLRIPTAPREKPDAIFIGMQLADVAALHELATIGEAHGVPIIAAVDEGLPFANLSNLDDTEASEAWAEFRASSVSPWLAAAMNPVVLVNEETAIGHRLLGGSPAFALAAMMAEQLDRERGLQPISGPSRAWISPAAHDTEVGPGEVRTIPTAYFAPIRLQEIGARLGVIVLGSEAGRDRVVLVDTPMASTDGASLIARIRQAHAARSAAF